MQPLYLIRPNVEYHVPGKGIIRVLGLADLGLKQDTYDECYQVRTAIHLYPAWRPDKSCLSHGGRCCGPLRLSPVLVRPLLNMTQLLHQQQHPPVYHTYLEQMQLHSMRTDTAPATSAPALHTSHTLHTFSHTVSTSTPTASVPTQEDHDNYIDICLAGSRDAVAQITGVEMPAGNRTADPYGRYRPMYNPGGPGNDPTPGVKYTHPSAWQLQAVAVALREPGTVTLRPARGGNSTTNGTGTDDGRK